MKKYHYSLFSKGKLCQLSIISFVCFFVTLGINAQQTTTYNITSEILTKTLDIEYVDSNFIIHSVIESNDIEYHEYVQGQVPNDEHQRFIAELQQYQSEYDKYTKLINDYEQAQRDLTSIRTKIYKFLNSNDKYRDKEHYLAEAQKLIESHNIKLTTQQPSTGMFGESNGYGLGRPRPIILYQPGSKSKNRDVQIFQQELEKIVVHEPKYQSHGLDQYLNIQKVLDTLSKTKKGIVVSDKISKRNGYLIDSTTTVDPTELIGNFEIFPSTYSLILDNSSNHYVKNELAVNDDLYNTLKHNLKSYENFKSSKDFPILRNIETNKMYYIMSDNFVDQIQREIDNKQYLGRINSDEYKSWKAKYQQLQASAQTHIDACEAIIKKHTFRNVFDEKKYDSSDFTQQEKAIFNKNLDLLKSKLDQLEEMAADRDFSNHYYDQIPMNESTRVLNLSNYYNSTRKAY